MIGRGAYGKVFLVKRKDDESNTLYAMKVLKKAELKKRNQIEHTKTERRILERMKDPFIVRLNFAF